MIWYQTHCSVYEQDLGRADSTNIRAWTFMYIKLTTNRDAEGGGCIRVPVGNKASRIFAAGGP